MDLDQDENSNADVKVKIGIFGKRKSGRSSFVNVVLGLQEHQGTLEDIPSCKQETTYESDNHFQGASYSHPESSNVIFQILEAGLDDRTNKTLNRFKNRFDAESYDVFLIFISSNFTRKHEEVAEKIKSVNKPYFVVLTKFDGETQGEQFDPEASLKIVKERLDEDFKELKIDGGKHDLHFISNLHPYQEGFLKLTKNISDALSPPQRKCLAKIPKVQELISLHEFHNFMKEVETHDKNVIKLPIVTELQRLFAKSGITGIQRRMNERLFRWKDITINLAILGNSGTGKSSFINAIRGVEDHDPKSAATGVVETTRVPKPFEHPTNSKIRFWDLPGIGTPGYPNLSIFCEKVAIEKYDTFLIICARRFTQHDLQLAKKVQEMGKSFFFIRTKIDSDVRNEQRGKPRLFDESRMLEQVREDCQKNLEEFNLGEEKVFLVSNHHPAKWDFDRLQKAILDQLPFHQKEALMFCLRSSTNEMLKEKITVLKGRVWMVATASVASKFALGPFSLWIDNKLIRDKVKFYAKQLELPEPGSTEFLSLSKELQKSIQMFYNSSGKDDLRWLKSFDRENKFNIRIYRKAIVTSNPLSFVYHILNIILDRMGETAACILCEAATKQPEVESDSEFD